MFSGSRFHEEMSRLSVKEKKLAAQKLLFPALFSFIFKIFKLIYL